MHHYPYVRIYSRRRVHQVTVYARCEDTPGGRPRHVNLTRLGLRSEPQFMAWARRESRRITERLGLSPGGPVRTVAEAASEWLAAVKADGKRPATLRAYRAAAKDVVRVLGANVPVSTVSSKQLWELRADLTRGAPSGQVSRLRRARILLDYLRRSGQLFLTKDEVADAMDGRGICVDRPAPVLLDPAMIHGLVEAGDRSGTPLVRIQLLTGMRIQEALGLLLEELELPHAIRLSARTKTRRGRLIDLSVCPSVADLIGDRSWQTSYHAARDWLAAQRQADGITWGAFRSTCASYLHSMPGLGWTHYVRAAQLGHTVQVAQRHYLNVVRGIPNAATTLEQAMGLEPIEESSGGEGGWRILRGNPRKADGYPRTNAERLS